MKRILIADDEPRIRRIVSLLLGDAGYEVKTASNGGEAVALAESFAPDIILLDQQMPVMNGTEAMQRILKKNPDQVIILMTAYGTISLAVEAVKGGAYDFIEKPFDNNELLLKVKNAIGHGALKQQVEQLQQQLDGGPRPIMPPC